MTDINSTSPVFSIGVDVSHWDDVTDFNQLKNGGVKYAFVKICEGASYKDDKFQKNWNGFKSVGVPVSPYIFFNPYASADQHASNFKAVYDGSADMPICVDWEQVGNKTKEWHFNEMYKLLTWIERAFGRKPIIYSASWFFNELGGVPNWINNYPLFLASYPYAVGKVETTWDSWVKTWIPKKWGVLIPSGVNASKVSFWQCSGDKFKLNGLDSLVDIDLYNGSYESFQSTFVSNKQAQPKTEMWTVASWVTAGLNLRSAPNSNSIKLGLLKIGMTFEMIQFDAGWSHIKFNGIDGYCASVINGLNTIQKV